jgi:predicted ABC-type ATPase
MKNLYIIAGPNGAGKTTLSYTILPEIFECEDFVNADEIARGLSPFNPEKAAIKSGRLMLERIAELLEKGQSFAFETTLSTRSYINLVKQAKVKGYEVILFFLALESVNLAIERVEIRVSEGGHNIPIETIKRRYEIGLRNLFQLYIPIVDKWMVVDNSSDNFEFVAEGTATELIIRSEQKWSYLSGGYYGNKGEIKRT